MGGNVQQKCSKCFEKSLRSTLSSENDDVNCAMARRLIRMLKMKLFRFFCYRVATKYIDKLQGLIKSYNMSVHSAHGMRPVDVSKNNLLDVYNRFQNAENFDIPLVTLCELQRTSSILRKAMCTNFKMEFLR